MVCETPLDAVNFAKELDIDQFSVIVAVGDDSTFNEVANGMLAREDGRKLPFAVVPNGNVNEVSDLCMSLGITSLDHALDQIVKAEATPIDTTRVLIDYERENLIPAEEDKLNWCRHMLSNSCMAVPAKIQGSQNSLNVCCGGASGSLATIWNGGLMGYTLDAYSVEIDGVAMEDSNTQTCMLSVNNGRYSNGGYAINPFACLNDGLLDVSWIRD